MALSSRGFREEGILHPSLSFFFVVELSVMDTYTFVGELLLGGRGQTSQQLVSIPFLHKQWTDGWTLVGVGTTRHHNGFLPPLPSARVDEFQC